ncbi:transposase [Hydrogenophaga sp.]|uniref:transposase n=1 Tax=Hydrogenophaga sp. TaxID=1904254 RepID=UPI0027347667|nr:transposase [Hydrogenophaga sp.]MDP3887515.1 transposase [Hydrogenophaga sp.]MDZ4177372.1 transposase [Hydrogenophaga sp.]
MRKSILTEEQIVGFFKQAEVGMRIRELCRTASSSDSTFFGWCDKLGGMQVSKAQRLLTEAHRDMHALVAVCGDAGRRHAAKIRTSTACCGTLEVMNTPRYCSTS